MNTIKVELVTPEEIVFSTNADSAVIPGLEGDFGVLEKHSPMISTLREGNIIINEGSKTRKIPVTSGFVEVTNERCTILAEQSQTNDE